MLDEITQFCSDHYIVAFGIVVSVGIGLIMTGFILATILQTPVGERRRKNTNADR